MTPEHPLKQLSPHNFLKLGINQIAYIRQGVDEDDNRVFTLHAADGTLLSIQNAAADVILIARTNDLAPMTVH